jgi:hypothetical protein
MKQVIQFYKDRRLEVMEAPTPSPRSGHFLVRTTASLVSVGTEKSMLELARKSLVGKALARLDVVRKVISKAQAKSFMRYHQQVRL